MQVPDSNPYLYIANTVLQLFWLSRLGIGNNSISEKSWRHHSERLSKANIFNGTEYRYKTVTKSRVSDPQWFKADPEFFIIADPDPGFWWPKTLKRLYIFKKIKTFLIKYSNLLILKGFLNIQHNKDVHFLENLRTFVASYIPLDCKNTYVDAGSEGEVANPQGGHSIDVRGGTSEGHVCKTEWIWKIAKSTEQNSVKKNQKITVT
jgi:hypothetical protein